jgi:hypothetical protein
MNILCLLVRDLALASIFGRHLNLFRGEKSTKIELTDRRKLTKLVENSGLKSLIAE